MIKKAVGYKTEDGRMFASLNEAAGHSFGQRIKEALGKRGSGVFGVNTILENSREIETILHEYNEEWTAWSRTAPHERPELHSRSSREHDSAKSAADLSGVRRSMPHLQAQARAG